MGMVSGSGPQNVSHPGSYDDFTGTPQNILNFLILKNPKCFLMISYDLSKWRAA